MKHSKPTQAQRVLDYMVQFGSITQFEAFRDLGVMRLASRVSDLRSDGYDIIGERVSVKNRFGENCSIMKYRINDSEKEA